MSSSSKRLPFARLTPALAALLVLSFLNAARAEDKAAAAKKAEPEKYVRFVDDGHGGGRLETAAVTFRNPAGQTVKLVAAVHIGETAYYQELNKAFEKDDAVLYELVKEKDAVLPRPGELKERKQEPGENPIGDFQRFLKDSLKLDYQLDVIDYTRPNFVHADLDRATFEKMQADRGESMTTLMLKQFMAAMNDPKKFAGGQQGTTEDMLKDAVKLLTRPDMERQLKLYVARQMDDLERMTAGLEGPDGSVILTERNKACMKVLSDTLGSGKKNISIFYGAAHLPDMAKRLRAMGFEPVASEWHMAWDLAIRTDEPSAIEKLLMEAIDVLGEGLN
jgi:hypothetical protein